MLLAAAIAALLWANSSAAESYSQFWASHVSVHFAIFSLSHSLREWINDALMVIFFFVVGLEIKRELAHGELSGWRRSSLPIICALGGMIVPAAIYLGFNTSTHTASGWGIPMATDIAFSLGVISLIESPHRRGSFYWHWQRKSTPGRCAIAPLCSIGVSSRFRASGAGAGRVKETQWPRSSPHAYLLSSFISDLRSHQHIVMPLTPDKRSIPTEAIVAMFTR